MATLLKVLNNLADIKSAGGVALRVRTQAVDPIKRRIRRRSPRNIPSSLRSLSVRSGRIERSIRFSAKRSAYSDKPCRASEDSRSGRPRRASGSPLWGIGSPAQSRPQGYDDGGTALSEALSRWPRIVDSGGVRCHHGNLQAIDFPVCGR
jgi:hypothetical protein